MDNYIRALLLHRTLLHTLSIDEYTHVHVHACMCSKVVERWDLRFDLALQLAIIASEGTGLAHARVLFAQAESAQETSDGLKWFGLGRAKVVWPRTG